jgi:hypothetical protein
MRQQAAVSLTMGISAIMVVHTIPIGRFVLQVVDFQWNPHDPWTLMSVSDESQMEGGGTLQLWRISDLIHRPEEEVLAEMEANRCVFKCCCWPAHCCPLPQAHELCTLANGRRERWGIWKAG